MSFNFNIRTLDDEKDIPKLMDFLAKQDLGYPNYQDWFQRAEYEIYIGYKKPILASFDNYFIGDLIYQPHKELPRTRELKNLRVHHDFRRRDIAHFMLNQAEVNDREEYDMLICDLHSNELGMRHLLKSMNYEEIKTTNLYDKNVEDIVLVKNVA